jgi:predicted  nucleic acid-binding Zn-ribbon protein
VLKQCETCQAVFNSARSGFLNKCTSCKYDQDAQKRKSSMMITARRRLLREAVERVAAKYKAS